MPHFHCIYELLLFLVFSMNVFHFPMNEIFFFIPVGSINPQLLDQKFCKNNNWWQATREKNSQTSANLPLEYPTESNFEEGANCLLLVFFSLEIAQSLMNQLVPISKISLRLGWDHQKKCRHLTFWFCNTDEWISHLQLIVTGFLLSNKEHSLYQM